jgi:AbiV family abortive infection protein
MSKCLSKYKFKKLATESLINGIRLHFDSILLFRKKSYASSCQLSILALEEISKAHWIEHYYHSSVVNGGFPDNKFEQKWLSLLFIHHIKQSAFFSWSSYMEFSPKFVKLVSEKQLDYLKQKATYVGLDKKGKVIDIESRISSPKQIKLNDAKKIISLLNDHLLGICNHKINNYFAFDIDEMDAVISKKLFAKLNKWQHRSGLFSKKWFKEWLIKINNNTK